jgi:hypothetical protein
MILSLVGNLPKNQPISMYFVSKKYCIGFEHYLLEFYSTMLNTKNNIKIPNKTNYYS